MKGNCDVYSSGEIFHPCCSDDDSTGTLLAQVSFLVPLLVTLSRSSPGLKYSYPIELGCVHGSSPLSYVQTDLTYFQGEF